MSTTSDGSRVAVGLFRTDDEPPRHDPYRPGLAFAVLGTVQATLIFTIMLVSVPLPRIGTEFGLVAADLVLIQAAYGLPFSGLLLFGGRLADRFGGRHMLVIGLSLFGFASAVAAFAPGFSALVTVRFLQGVGAAMIAPAAMAVLRAVYPEPVRYGRAMATWGGLSVLGATSGTLLSGAMTNWVSWRWMFAVPVAVSLVALVSAKHVLPTIPPPQSGRGTGLDPVGAVLATLGISVGSFGLIVSGEHSWSSPIVFLPTVFGVLALGAFIVVERRVRDPLLPPGFVRETHRVVGLVGILLAATGAALVSLLLSLYLQQQHGWSPLATAGAFVPYAVALIVTGQAAAPLVARYGAARVTIAGLVIGAIGLALLAGISADSSYGLGLLPGMVLLPVGAALVFAGTAVLATRDVAAHQAGLAGGVMNTAMELGPTIGLATLMAIAATRTDVIDGYTWAFASAGIAFIVAAITAAIITTRGSAHGGSPDHDMAEKDVR